MAGSIALSMGAVLNAVPLFVPSGAVFAAGALSIRFPQAGMGLVLLAGAFTVFAGIVFLRYPRFSSPGDSSGARNLVMTLQSTAGGIVVRRAPDSANLADSAASLNLADPSYPVSSSDPVNSTEIWNLAEGAGNLYFDALAVEADPRYPVFGGERRGLFSGAGRGDEALFSVRTPFFKAPPAFSPSPLPASSPAFLSEEIPKTLGFPPRFFRTELPVQAVFQGMSFSVIFSGAAIEFDPPPRPEDF
jgi:hypothetical protein